MGTKDTEETGKEDLPSKILNLEKLDPVPDDKDNKPQKDNIIKKKEQKKNKSHKERKPEIESHLSTDQISEKLENHNQDLPPKEIIEFEPKSLRKGRLKEVPLVDNHEEDTDDFDST